MYRTIGILCSVDTLKCGEKEKIMARRPSTIYKRELQYLSSVVEIKFIFPYGDEYIVVGKTGFKHIPAFYKKGATNMVLRRLKKLNGNFSLKEVFPSYVVFEGTPSIYFLTRRFNKEYMYFLKSHNIILKNF